jgi:hypothetical protein
MHPNIKFLCSKNFFMHPNDSVACLKHKNRSIHQNLLFLNGNIISPNGFYQALKLDSGCSETLF